MANPEWTDPEDWGKLFDGGDLAALTKSHRAAIADAWEGSDALLYYRAPSYRSLHAADSRNIAHDSDGLIMWLTPKGEAVRQHLMATAGVVE